MRYLKYFFYLISSFLVISCIGEDIESGNIDLSIQNDGLFSLGLNESNSEVLQLKTSLDGDNNFKILWDSSNPEVINVNEKGLLIVSNKEDQIGKSTIISAKAFNAEDVNENGTLKEGVLSVAEITPIDLKLGKITIRAIQVVGLSNDELENLAKFGFEEELRKINSLSSIDISDKTQQLSVNFINFQKEIIENPKVEWSSSNTNVLDVDENGVLDPKEKSEVPVVVTVVLPASLTSAKQDIVETFEIVVGEQTQVVDPDPTPEEERVLIGSGTFQANNGYNSRGGFQIFREADGKIVLELDANFVAPIPNRELYASNTTGNDVSTSSLISRGFSSSGAQSFEINFDITNFKYIYIYCASIRRNAGFGEIK